METNVLEPHTRIRPSICIDNLAAGTVLRQSGTESAQGKETVLRQSGTESAQENETAEASSPPETGVYFVIIRMLVIYVFVSPKTW